MDKILKLEEDIKNLKIQGATGVALAVLEGIRYAGDFCRTGNDLIEIGKKLAYARPTEPLAQNALRFIFQGLGKDAAYYLEKIDEYKSLINKAKERLINNSLHGIENDTVYLVHCHSSSVVASLIKGSQQGKKFSIFATETRPLFQGRITVNELLRAGFSDVTMIIDTVASSLILAGEMKIDAVFVGADLLSETGFVNKVGTLAIVHAAIAKGLPVYVFSTLLKFDPRPFLPDFIEKRNGSEIWNEAPKNLKFYAPAFDFIPYQDNLRIVCEKGILSCEDIRNEALALYPFLRREL